MADPDIVTGLRTDAALFGKMPPHAKVNMNPEFMREMSQLWIAAANEIERLREELTASHESHGNEVGALTERLSLAIHERDEARRERDSARRMYCSEMAHDGNSPADVAEALGWDITRKEANV